jgi:hypothetical protein
VIKRVRLAWLLKSSLPLDDREVVELPEFYDLFSNPNMDFNCVLEQALIKSYSGRMFNELNLFRYISSYIGRSGKMYIADRDTITIYGLEDLNVIERFQYQPALGLTSQLVGFKSGVQENIIYMTYYRNRLFVVTESGKLISWNMIDLSRTPTIITKNFLRSSINKIHRSGSYIVVVLETLRVLVYNIDSLEYQTTDVLDSIRKCCIDKEYLYVYLDGKIIMRYRLSNLTDFTSKHFEVPIHYMIDGKFFFKEGNTYTIVNFDHQVIAAFQKRGTPQEVTYIKARESVYIKFRSKLCIFNLMSLEVSVAPKNISVKGPKGSSGTTIYSVEGQYIVGRDSSTFEVTREIIAPQPLGGNVSVVFSD